MTACAAAQTGCGASTAAAVAAALTTRAASRAATAGVGAPATAGGTSGGAPGTAITACTSGTAVTAAACRAASAAAASTGSSAPAAGAGAGGGAKSRAGPPAGAGGGRHAFRAIVRNLVQQGPVKGGRDGVPRTGRRFSPRRNPLHQQKAGNVRNLQQGINHLFPVLRQHPAPGFRLDRKLPVRPGKGSEAPVSGAPCHLRFHRLLQFRDLLYCQHFLTPRPRSRQSNPFRYKTSKCSHSLCQSTRASHSPALLPAQLAHLGH